MKLTSRYYPVSAKMSSARSPASLNLQVHSLPLYFPEGLFRFILVVVREMRDRPRLDISAVISLTCTYQRGEVQAVV